MHYLHLVSPADCSSIPVASLPPPLISLARFSTRLQVNGKELSRLSQGRPAGSLRAMRDPLLIQVVRRGPRRKGGSGGPMVTTGAAMVSDCADSSTQTDISFQHMQSVGRAGHSRAGPSPPPPSPPLHPVLEPYLLSEPYVQMPT